MIHHGLKEIMAVYAGKTPITAIYKGAQLVWESIRSCFGRGFWVDEAPWNDDDAWMD